MLMYYLKRRMISEILKFSFHHRAFWCYAIMTIWIFILMTVMYKYMSLGDEATSKKAFLNQYRTKADVKFNTLYLKYCNPTESIVKGSEGIVDSDIWHLQGILIATRHGDRGPLTHLRDGDRLPCNFTPKSILLKSYEDFVRNASSSGRAPWVQAPGPFHNFPSLPVKGSSTSCALGQLTTLGVLQMLTVGAILREAYSDKFGWNDNLKDFNGKLISGDVISYSTRYRRTYQSAVALLWAFSPQAFIQRASALRESHSVAFCFRDCACPATDMLLKKMNREVKSRLESHHTVKLLISKISKVIFESQEYSDPEVFKDALLAYMCHDARLPCTQKSEPDNQTNMKVNQKTRNSKRNLLESDDAANFDFDYLSNMDFNNEIGRKARDIINKYYDINSKLKVPLDFDAQMEREKVQYYQQRYMDIADSYDDVVVVKKNLDADFNFNSEGKIDSDFDDDYKDVTQSYEQVCLRKDYLISLFAYIEWSYKKDMLNVNNYRKGLLTAYGLIHNIVQNMIRMISENRPKVVLYSGHDKTLQALILALGVKDFRYYHIRYASRIVLEIYRRKDLRDEFRFMRRKAIAQDFYFRVVFNGEDITNDLSFCRTENTNDKNAIYEPYLCPIENIVRFIHDDYFAMFNVSNFKDACAVYKKGKHVI